MAPNLSYTTGKTRVVRALQLVGWEKAVRCDVNPGEVGFRPRFVGVDGVWKDFWNDGETLSSSGASERPPPVFAGLSPPRVSLALRAAQPLNDKPM